MFEQYIQQLKSSDPQQRRLAIIGLADSGDPKAVEILRRVAKTDPVPALRAIAEKAEQHAQRKQWRGMDAPAPSSIAPQVSAAPKSQSETSYIGGSDNRDRARAQINNAYSHVNNGDKGNAARALTQALELDPSLRDSDEIRELASTITGEPPNQAVEWLLDKKRQHDSKVRKSSGSGESFGASMTNLAIEVVIMFVLGFGIVYLYANYFIKAPEVLAMYREYASSSAYAARTLAQIQSIRPTDLMPISLIGSVVILVSTLVVTALMFVGGLFMGGTGTIPNFMDKLMRVQVVIYLITLIGAVLLFVTANSSASTRNGMFNAVNSLSSLSSIGALIASTYYAAKTHEFGYIKGFLTVISPAILLCVCYCVLIIFTVSQR